MGKTSLSAFRGQRRTWDRSPVERVKGSARAYDRNRGKREAKAEIEENMSDEELRLNGPVPLEDEDWLY